MITRVSGEQEDTSRTRAPAPRLPRATVVYLLILGLVITAALAVRFSHIRTNEPPLDFYPTRQYRSALIARAYYFAAVPSLPAWQRQVARVNQELEGLLEPPILELATAAAYRVVGGEHLWIPQAFSAIFWVVGGIFLYITAKQLFTQEVALFSSIFYLFLPYSILASTSFQPDALMIMMMLASIFAFLRYTRQASLFLWVIAAITSATTIFIKPLSLFVLSGALISLAVWRSGTWKVVVTPRIVILLFVSLLPTLLYYGYGIVLGGMLREQAQYSFLPSLLLQSSFWLSWLARVNTVTGYAALAGGLLGVLLCRGGVPKALLVGVWSGYVLLGLVFNYHFATHDYYHNQLIPIIALSLGPVCHLVLSSIDRRYRAVNRGVAKAIALILLGVLFIGQAPERNRDAPRTDEVRMAQEIGEAVGHSTRTIVLDRGVGYPLRYHGQIAGIWWPLREHIYEESVHGRPERTAEERLRDLERKYAPEYFIVADLVEFENQGDIRALLMARFPILVQSEAYVIFDLRNRVGAPRRAGSGLQGG